MKKHIETVKGLKMSYTGIIIDSRQNLPKSAKLFSCEYTEDLKRSFNVYYSKGMVFYICFDKY